MQEKKTVYLLLGGTGAVILIVAGIALFTTSAPNQTQANTNNGEIRQFTATTAQTDTKDLKIKGNRNSRIFHLPGCASYNQIKDKNVLWFKTVEEAETAGFRMAKNC